MPFRHWMNGHEKKLTFNSTTYFTSDSNGASELKLAARDILAEAENVDF